MILRLDESFETLIVHVDEIRMNSMDETENNHSDNKDKKKSESDLIDYENEMKDRMHKISMHETEVVNMMAKISLLTIISEIFVNIFLIMVAYEKFKEAHAIDVSFEYIIVEQSVIIVAVCLNCFTLYAMFVLNDQHYIKFCGFCHKGLKKCCVMCVTRSAFHGRR